MITYFTYYSSFIMSTFCQNNLIRNASSFMRIQCSYLTNRPQAKFRQKGMHARSLCTTTMHEINSCYFCQYDVPIHVIIDIVLVQFCGFSGRYIAFFNPDTYIV